MLPKTLAVAASYNPEEVPLGHGGFARVWKGRSQDRDVAVKVLDIYQCNDREKIRRVSLRRYSMRFGKLTVMCAEVL